MTSAPPPTLPDNPIPTQAAGAITSRPPASSVALTHEAIPRHADHPQSFGLPSELETVALIGRLIVNLDAYAAEAEADRVRASEDRVKAELDRKQFRAWFARSSATQDAQLGLIRGDIQRINRRLEEGDAEFKAHRAELEAKDGRIAELVDCVSALNLEVQASRSLRQHGGAAVLGGLLVLVLEDNDTLRGAVTRICEDAGASVVQATTVVEASAILVSGAPQPDVVTVDLKLARGADAFPFVRELRANHHAGVIILTGAISAQQADEARELGVEVMMKPFTLDGLLGAIKHAARA